MIVDACTLFDLTHSTRGALCCESMNHPGQCRQAYALCLDSEALNYIATRSNVTRITLEQIENTYRSLLDVKNKRPWNAYAVTLKPFLVGYMLNVIRASAVTMVDSDVLFYTSVSEIVKELAEYDVLVTSRRQNPVPRQGNVNGGFFACKNTEKARNFINWWQEKVLEWCLWEHGPGGLHGEEGYLRVIDERPEDFPGCAVSGNPGINMAWWSVKNHFIEANDEGYVIDGKGPLICFHFQGNYMPTGLSGPVEQLYSNYMAKLK